MQGQNNKVKEGSEKKKKTEIGKVNYFIGKDSECRQMTKNMK